MSKNSLVWEAQLTRYGQGCRVLRITDRPVGHLISRNFSDVNIDLFGIGSAAYAEQMCGTCGNTVLSRTGGMLVEQKSNALTLDVY